MLASAVGDIVPSVTDLADIVSRGPAVGISVAADDAFAFGNRVSRVAAGTISIDVVVFLAEGIDTNASTARTQIIANGASSTQIAVELHAVGAPEEDLAVAIAWVHIVAWIASQAVAVTRVEGLAERVDSLAHVF